MWMYTEGCTPVYWDPFEGAKGDYIGSYKGFFEAILGKPCRGTTLGDLRGTTLEPFKVYVDVET